MKAVTAFREEYTSSAGVPSDGAEYDSLEARLVRYAIYWALYENSAYRDIHDWSSKFRATYGLYDYIRGIYNPTHRIGEAWRTFIWGGRLDPKAGEGDPRIAVSAIPIDTENDKVRDILSLIWRWSNWQIKKNLVPLHGAILGDAVIKVVDDDERKRAYMVVIHPSTISDVVLDELGYVKGYTIQENREDDENADKLVLYTEECFRDDAGEVSYITYKENREHGWYEQPASWTKSYGFVPLVLIQHNDIGFDFGEAEIMAGLPKCNEVNDLASNLSDQIRKMVNAAWFFAGVKKPEKPIKFSSTTATTTRPEPGREEVPALYASEPNATAKPLVSELAIGDVSLHIERILKELERDYPELQMDIWTHRGDTSSKALRVARQRVDAKVSQRRGVYDHGLARAQMMTISLGAQAEYPGFEQFNEHSYDLGEIEHSIGVRSAFLADPLDRHEEVQQFWAGAKAATDAGADLRGWLLNEGLPIEDVDLLAPELEEEEPQDDDDDGDVDASKESDDKDADATDEQEE